MSFCTFGARVDIPSFVSQNAFWKKNGGEYKLVYLVQKVTAHDLCTIKIMKHKCPAINNTIWSGVPSGILFSNTEKVKKMMTIVAFY